MKRILATLTGCVVGILVIFISEALSHVIYPPPAQIDPNNIEQLKEILANAPISSLILVLVGAFLGAFVGGTIASIVIKTKDVIPALLVGTILTILGVLNLLIIPHPIWFNISALFVYLIGSYSGYIIYSKLKKNA